jgi:hypothetical protein
MFIICFEKKQYYKADDVKEEYNFLFKRCKRIRNIVERRKIQPEDYCYAVLRKNKWELDKAGNPHAVLFLRKQYVDNIIKRGDIELNNNSSDDEVKKPKNKLKNNEHNDSDNKDTKFQNTPKKQKNIPNIDSNNEINNPGLHNLKKTFNSDSDDEIQVEPKIKLAKKNKQILVKDTTDTYVYNKELVYIKTINGKVRKYYKMPPILELKDSEKFKDEHNNTLEIQVRGIRDKDLCFFKLADVSDEFDMKRLRDVVVRDGSSYIVDIDYIFFACPTQSGNEIQSQGEDLYLTYNGVVRMLYVSNSLTARHFQEWASKSLFTIQIGTTESKYKLCANILGTSVSDIKRMLKSAVGRISCVYLLSIGITDDVKDSMCIKIKYKGTYIVIKFGKTVNLDERIDDHIRDYGDINGSQLAIKFFAQVDPEYLTEAEGEIREYFREFKINYDGHTELAMISEDKLKDIALLYKHIETKYGSRVSQKSKIIIDLEHKKEVIGLEHKLGTTTLECENKLLRKDIEMMKLEKQTLCDKYKTKVIENAELKKRLQSKKDISTNDSSDNDDN